MHDLQRSSSAAMVSLKNVDSSAAGDTSFDSGYCEPLQASPTSIFRYLDGSEEESVQESLAPIHRANPVVDQRNDMDEDQDRASLAHAPLLPMLREDIGRLEEEESRDIKLDYVAEHETDYSHYFDLGAQSMMECDDFSVSSAEANSIMGLEAASDDPSSFWEEGVNLQSTDRSESPTPVSVADESAASPRWGDGSSSSLFYAP